MSYISEIFDRAHIQHIREFLLHGVECVEVSNKSYKQRLAGASLPARDMIHAKFSDEKEYEEIMTTIYNYASVNQDVYMEIGLQCGASLAMQFIDMTDTE